MNDGVRLKNGSLLDDRASGLSRTLILLVAWFFVAIALGLGGALGADGKPPAALGAAIALPLVAFALDGRFGHPLFRGLARLDLATLTALQTFRVGGAFFLVAWGAGTLPAGFAAPAGIGDVAIGIAAPLVAAAVAGGKPHHRALALVWNLLGLADLVIAVSLGVTHSSSSFGVLSTSTSVTTDALARYPFSLIPTFLVPLAIILHVSSLRVLLARGSRAA